MKDEGDLEQWVADRAWTLYGVPSVHMSIQGNTGWQDRLYILPAGRTLWHEYKLPGEPLAARQTLTRAILEYRHHAVQTHVNRDEALAAIHDALRQAELEATRLPKTSRTVPVGARRSRSVP